MAIEAGLTYNIGADISKFESSIGKVEEQLKYLKEALKSASGKEIEKLNADIFSLQNTLKNLKGVGVPAAQSIEKIADASKGARIALTSVNQVVQDLPFGFIGIQNNLPNLFQSFSKLSKEAGGIVGAFKAIDKATLITSGLFLAFNVATSAITFLIQKYGSLGEAFDSLFGKINLVKQAQESYNKELAKSLGSTATESAEISILVKTLTDLSKPLKERQAAYVELKKISPDVVAGIKLENISYADSIKLINSNAKAIQELLILKAQESAVSNILTKNKEELATLQIEESRLLKEQSSAQRDYNKSKTDGFLVLGAGRTSQQTNLIALNNASSAIAKNKVEQEKLNKIGLEYLKILEPTIKEISAIDLKTKQLIESEKKLNEESNKKIKQPKVKVEKELKGRAVAFDFQVLNVDKSLIQISNIKKSIDDLLKPKISAFNLEIPDIKNRLQPQIDAIQQFVLKSQEAKNQLSEFFFDPLANLFSDLATNSKTAFKNFTDAILSSIRKIVAEIIAKKIISLLASFIPGIGAAGAAIKAGSAIAGVLSSGGMLTRSANFGGVQGGGMGMSGSVNLILRGTDLVGSINRTNMQLNRVG